MRKLEEFKKEQTERFFTCQTIGADFLIFYPLNLPPRETSNLPPPLAVGQASGLQLCWTVAPSLSSYAGL